MLRAPLTIAFAALTLAAAQPTPLPKTSLPLPWRTQGILLVAYLEDLRCPALFRTEVVFANLMRGGFLRVTLDWKEGPVVNEAPTVLSHWLRPQGPWPTDIWVHHVNGGACVLND